MAIIFDSKIRADTETGCHEWTGRTEKRFGRGVYFTEGKDIFAHRFAYERARGSVPERMVVRQMCGNVLCCNPEHLTLESPAEAAMVQAAAGRTRKGADFDARLALRNKTGCLEWTGSATPHGYGRVRIAGTVWLAHRFAYTRAFGPIPAGMNVCHRCDNTSCCNPEHLFLGTQGDNVKDMAAKGRTADRRGEANGSAKLTMRKVRTIRRLRAMGASRAELAAKFGLSGRSIANIELGKTWAHVEPDPHLDEKD